MLQFDVSAQVRKTFGKGAARAMRRGGQSPAVLYGPKIDPVALEVDAKSFTKTLLAIQRRNAVINLAIDGGKGKKNLHVMIKEIQKDPVADQLIHTDFYEISMDTPMTLPVPIKYIGKAKGVELGGFLEVSVTELPLKGLVLDIPDFLEVDVSALEIGDRLTCKDIAIPSNSTLEKSLDTVCVFVAASGPVLRDEEEEAEEKAAPAPEEAEAPAE